MSTQLQTEPAAENPQLWTVKEVCSFLQCSPRNVHNLREQGLPWIKLGQLVRFDPAAVMAWAKSKTF